MSTWQLQDAKARFSELIHSAVTSGPQIITRRGVETAVIVPFEEWKRSQLQAPSLLQTLQSGPQFELNIPPRGRVKTRRASKR